MQTLRIDLKLTTKAVDGEELEALKKLVDSCDYGTNWSMWISTKEGTDVVLDAQLTELSNLADKLCANQYYESVSDSTVSIVAD
jgi:hypothetical protein